MVIRNLLWNKPLPHVASSKIYWVQANGIKESYEVFKDENKYRALAIKDGKGTVLGLFNTYTEAKEVCNNRNKELAERVFEDWIQ